jgi:hypothetical protein
MGPTQIWLLALFIFAIALALALGIVLARFWPLAAPTEDGIFKRIWNGLTPNFAEFNTERVTTQTIHLLVNVMLVFGFVAVLWAAGAGVMRTAWLFAARPGAVAAGLSGQFCQPSGCPRWLLFGVLVWQLVRAVGGVLLICLASALAGALLGFIFGIPRPIGDAERPSAATAAAAPPPGTDHRQAAEAYKLSTNLTKISDWLTTAIVGVGLVEAKNTIAQIGAISGVSSDWLFENRHGSPALITAAIVGGGVLGFLYAYLYAQLIISRLIVAVARALVDATSSRTMSSFSFSEEPKDQGQALAPRIPRAGRVETDVQPSLPQVQAALQYQVIRFEELISHPDVTAAEILNWARAHAILNDYRAAAQGYMHLLATTLNPRQP